MGQYYETKDGNNKAWTREKYLSFYYNKEEQNDPDFIDSFKMNLLLLNNTEIKPIRTQELKKVMS